MRIKTKAQAKQLEPDTSKNVPSKPVKVAEKKTASKTQRIAFSVRAEVGSKVFLAGSFNNWDPTAKEMVDKNGDGFYTTTLPRARHLSVQVCDRRHMVRRPRMH